MFSGIENRKKIILSTLLMVLLIWGVQGNLSYASNLSFFGSPTVNPISVPSGGGNFTLSFTVQSRPSADISTHPNKTAEVVTLVAYRTGSTGSVGSTLIESLATGHLKRGSITVPVPSVTTTTSHTYTIRIVSSTPSGSDTDTTDNTSSPVTATVTAGTANLSVSVTPSSHSVVPGQTFNLVATIRNSGAAPSVATTLQTYQRFGLTGVITPVGTAVSVPSIEAGFTDTKYIRLPAPVVLGTHFYRVQIGNDTTKISDWTSVTGTNIVDLSVGTLAVDKSTVAPGESFTLSTTVSNIGAGNFTGTTTLRYYQSADTTLNRTAGSDTEVGTDTISATLSGSYGTTSEDITLTAPVEPGTYYYFAYVDPVAGEQYYYGTNYGYYDRTANNTSAYVMVTVSAPPDLTVDLDRLRQATFAPGERFTLDATVRNSGTGASAATQLRVYEDSDDYRRELEIDRQSVRAISAGRSSSESISLIAPPDAGLYYYRVYVDTVTGETETDNNYSHWIGIDVLEPLVLESLEPSKVTLTSGETFTLTATVKNDGNARSDATTVRYYRSSDNSLSSRDTRLGNRTVSRLAAGATTQVSIPLTAPQLPGTYYYGACVGDSETYSGDACEVIKLNVLVVSVILPESQRPPMDWVDADSGTLQSLTGSEVDPFVASVRNATAIAIDMAGGKVYWAEQIAKNRSRVRRANLNGRNVEVVKEMGGAVRGLAIDSAKGHLYMTNARPNGRGNVQRSKLDGSVFHWNYIDNLSPSLSSPRDIALDVAGGKVYWTEDITDAATGKEIIRIRRANLNGKNVEVVREISGVPRGLAVDSAKGNLYLANTRGVRGNIQRLKVDGSLFHWNYIHIAKANSPQGVALDVAGGKVYWTEAGGIRRADLNGKNRQDVATGIGSPGGIVLRVAPVSTEVAAAPSAAPMCRMRQPCMRTIRTRSTQRRGSRINYEKLRMSRFLSTTHVAFLCVSCRWVIELRVSMYLAVVRRSGMVGMKWVNLLRAVYTSTRSRRAIFLLRERCLL